MDERMVSRHEVRVRVLDTRTFYRAGIGDMGRFRKVLKTPAVTLPAPHRLPHLLPMSAGDRCKQTWATVGGVDRLAIKAFVNCLTV